MHDYVRPKMFIFPKEVFIFLVTFILLSASALNLEESKILSFDKDLTLTKQSPLLMTLK